MANSDTKYGLFNKQTLILTQEIQDKHLAKGSPTLTVFASVDAAKSHIYTTEALAVFDECCSKIQWALMADGDGNNTKLKVTFAFGSKGGNIAPSDDWAGQYNSRKTALINSNGWMKENGTATVASTSEDHLF